MRFSQNTGETFTLYARPDGDLTLRAESLTSIGHKFSWTAFFLGPLWLFWHRLWVHGLLLAAFEIAIYIMTAYGILAPYAGMLALLATSCFIGAEGSEWRRRRAERNGLVLSNIILTQSAQEAEARTLRLLEAAAKDCSILSDTLTGMTASIEDASAAGAPITLAEKA